MNCSGCFVPLRLKQSFVLAATLCFLWLAAAWAHAQQIRIVAFGDSGVFGSGRSSATGMSGGVPLSQAFPALIERNLRMRGWDVKVTNKGVPGDLASRALARVDRDIPAGTHLTLVFIGGNDLRQRASPDAVNADRRRIVAAIVAKGSRAILIVSGPPPQANPDIVLWKAVPWAAGLWDPRTFYPAPQFDSGDREHLNAQGNELIAERAVPDIEEFLRNMGFQPKP